MGQHRPLLLFIFGLFKQTSLQILPQINVKKCPSSILCRDSNPRPLEHEGPLIATSPGLPPTCKTCLKKLFNAFFTVRGMKFGFYSILKKCAMFWQQTSFV